jgi:hypothetical protein
MFSRNKKDRPVSRASAPKLRARSKALADGVPVRVEFGVDSSTGVTMTRTPEPLPPSPAAADAGGWLDEHVVTSPAEIPDLGALAGGSDPDSVPGWALPPRDEHDVGATQEPAQPATGHARWFVLLVAATCLAVGMVLGALLQSQWGASECPDPAAHSSSQRP